MASPTHQHASCPECSQPLPDGESTCPSCTTSVLASDALAIDLDAPPPVVEGSAERPVDDEARFLPGDVLASRYRVVAALGRGGMGEVYRADDLRLGQSVALKFLPAAMEGDPAMRELLRNEVRLARRIVHPHVCRVYDVVEQGGLTFITMEHIDGEHLGSLLRRIGRLPRAKAVEIAHQLTDGLAAAHAEGILHRDLKPSNLMIDGRGRARITDFGLAVVAEGLRDKTVRGKTVHGKSVRGKSARAGTPLYMAPEQFAGREVTVRSDLYSLGLVLFELFTGRPAFPRPKKGSGDGRRDIAERGRPPRPSQVATGIESSLDRLLLQCLADKPEDRPPSAAAVAAALPSTEEAVDFVPEIGHRLPQRPNWRLERCLGAGGFGEAWLAAHVKTGELRVFKLCRDPEKMRALEREITLYRLLKETLGDRDDISRIHDWNFDTPPYWIESEYAAGGNLAEWAEAQGGLARIPLETRLEIVAQIADALAAAHSVGVLHKDVKPANVLLDSRDGGRPQVRLSDFGIGVAIDAERLAAAGITARGLSATGDAGGTPLYRAPELLEGKPATLQADIYALGVLLYQVVVGDFGRALGPGWERDVEDDLLREDIAAAVDVSPRRRLGNVLRLGERLREIERRRAEREAERLLAEESERARLLSERRRRQWRWAGVLAATILLVATAILQDERRARLAADAANEAARARDAARLAMAREQLGVDPTTAALVLLEVEEPDPGALSLVQAVLGEEIAYLELSHEREQVGPAAGAEVEAEAEETRVWDAAWSPDGALLATAASDGLLRLWEASSGALLATLEGHTGPILAIAWSPDGRRLATASSDATVRIWRPSAAGSEPPTVLAGHGERVWDVAWSPDGHFLASASWDRTARVWRVEGGASGGGNGLVEHAVLGGHADRVVSVDWSPDSRRLATASWDGTARIWDFEPDAPALSPVLAQYTLDAGDALWKASWNPDGERLVTAAWDGTARVWRVPREASRTVPPPRVLAGGGALWTASWDAQGKHILTASQDGTARIWDAAGASSALVVPGTSVENLPTVLWHGGAVLAAAWSPDGRQILTGSRDGVARLWRVRGDGTLQGEPRRLLARQGEVRTVAWSPDGRFVLTAARGAVARVWRADAASAEPRVLLADRPLERVAWSPDGRHLAAVAVDAAARVLKIEDGSLAAIVGGYQGALVALQWIADSEGGGRLASLDEDGVVRVAAALRDGTASVVGRIDGPLRTAAWTAGGGRLLAVSAEGGVRVWSADTLLPRGEPRRLPTFDGPLAAAGFGVGGRLRTVSTRGAVRFWERGGRSAVGVLGGRDFEGAELPTPGEIGDGASSALFVGGAWSPHGGLLATFSGDETVRVWRFEDPDEGSVRVLGEPLILRGHRRPVRGLAWSLDGALLATVSEDATVRVWRLEIDALQGVLRSATRVCLPAPRRAAGLGEAPSEAMRRFQECERSRGREP